MYIVHTPDLHSHTLTGAMRGVTVGLERTFMVSPALTHIPGINDILLRLCSILHNLCHLTPTYLPTYLPVYYVLIINLIKYDYIDSMKYEIELSCCLVNV